MAIDITKPLRKALSDLQAERRQIDQQIAAIENALSRVGGRAGRRRRALLRPAGGRRAQVHARPEAGEL